MLLKEYCMLLNELTRVALKYDQISVLFHLLSLLRVFAQENVILLSPENTGSLLVREADFPTQDFYQSINK